MRYNTITVHGLDVFYREDGDADKPVFLLLHGFPSSSHMFRNLMPLLAGRFHLIAPDFIGFGRSSAPRDFEYTFENLTDYVDGFLEALGIRSFYMYVFDYGAPIGFRLALRHPERILGIVSQNGNVYEEGLGKKWEARKEYWNDPTPEARASFSVAYAPETIYGQYTVGEEAGSVGPDGYTLDIFYSLDDGYGERQDDLIYDYRTNVALYPRFQEYLREYQPRLLAVWGKNDPSFIYQGAKAFARDVPNAAIVGLNGGHFVLESHYKAIADLILDFFDEPKGHRLQVVR